MKRAKETVFVVGIDPSLTSTGVAMVGPAGATSCAIRSKRGGLERVIEIRDRMLELIRAVPGQCGACCIEGPSFGSKGRAVFELGGLSYVLRLAIYEAGISVYVVPPAWVKQFATSKGNVAKHEVAVAVHKLWNFEAPTDDEIDAFVLAKIAEGIVREGVNGYYIYQQKIIDRLKGGGKG